MGPGTPGFPCFSVSCLILRRPWWHWFRSRFSAVSSPGSFPQVVVAKSLFSTEQPLENEYPNPQATLTRLAKKRSATKEAHREPDSPLEPKTQSLSVRENGTAP